MNRERFPGLRDGWARLDGPAGTQMVDAAIDAMADFMRSGDNANQGGVFEAAVRSDELVASARTSVGTLLGGDPRGVVFGPSMTDLTMRFAAAAGRTLQPGDEVVCTRLDHDANVAPWLIAAERAGATVRFADPQPGTLELPAAAVEAVLGERTRWVAVTAASNAVGTVPELAAIVAAAHAACARVYVDAVHAAPHRALEVEALGADALVCEGGGGFLVPLTLGYLVRDFARDVGLPIGIAAGAGLGTINHALLTIESVRAVGLEVAAVVLTPWPDRPGEVERSNREAVARLGAVRVEVLPRLGLRLEGLGDVGRELRDRGLRRIGVGRRSRRAAGRREPAGRLESLPALAGKTAERRAGIFFSLALVAPQGCRHHRARGPAGNS